MHEKVNNEISPPTALAELEISDLCAGSPHAVGWPGHPD
jgi:hypothetical protein